MLRFDVVIVGGGLVGLSLARALADSGLQLALVESHPPASADATEGWDARVYAISPGSEAFLRELDAWPEQAERLASVFEMRVHGDRPGSQLIFSAYQTHVARLATIAENRLLQTALWRSLNDRPAVRPFVPARCASVQWDDDAATLTLESGETLQAPLLVAADGADSWLRAQAGIGVRERPYQQDAVVANFAVERGHRGAAWQWFREDGVLALLPLPGDRASMVWSAERSLAQQLLMMQPVELCAAVARASGHALGELQLLGPAASFALKLTRVEALVRPRLALIGDAAHNFHPLAGQGVNLGFQDARELARVLRHRGGFEVGDYRLLRKYERARKEDILAMSLVTDGLQRLFNNRFGPLAWLRNRGLTLTDQIFPLKTLLARHALG